MKSWMFGRSCLVTLSISIFCLYFLSFYFDFKIRNIPGFKSFGRRALGRTVSNTTKTILFWNTMFSNENFYFGEVDVFRGCPVNDCYATNDRIYRNVIDFDAILFHGNELYLQDLPLARGEGQWYVYVNLESPENRPLVHPYFEDYFNVTMTYRLDSDIPWTYGIVRESRTDKIVAPLRNTSWRDLERTVGETRGFTTHPFYPGIDTKNGETSSLLRLLDGKSKPVIWFVSNCPARSGRMEYVKELSRHIGVDVFGDCGEFRCPRSLDCLRDIVEPDYFFYLSFENSLCQDYVTEKLYNPLRYNVVPVVYGGANYSLFAPPGSYVDVLDFESPRDLAAYLRRLIENPSEYLAYFRWKRYYRVEGGTRRAVCKVCEFLHERRGGKTYEELSDWYSRDKCPMQRFLTDQKYATRDTLKKIP